MAGIVESQQAETAPLGLGVERGRLGRVHVGAITAEPNDAWASAAHWRAATKGDTPLIRGLPDDEDLRLFVRHIELAADDVDLRDRAGMNPDLGAQGGADLAERSRQVNRSRVTLSCSRRGAP